MFSDCNRSLRRALRGSRSLTSLEAAGAHDLRFNRGRLERTFRILAPAVIGLTLCVGARAQTIDEARALTVDEIIDKHTAALGLDRLETPWMTITGSVTIYHPGFTFDAPFVLRLKHPNKYREDLKLYSDNTLIYSYILVYNGTTAWQFNSSNGQIRPVTDSATNDFLDLYEFLSPLTYYKAKGVTVELAGKEKVNGVVCYKLKLTMKRGTIIYSYLDAKSYLDVRCDAIGTLGGKPSVTETTYRNYKSFDGVLFPLTVEQKINGSPDHLTLKIEKIDFKRPIDDSIFEVTSAKK